MTTRGSKTKILSFPSQVTMVASAVTAFVSVPFLVRPERSTAASNDDD